MGRQASTALSGTPQQPACPSRQEDTFPRVSADARPQACTPGKQKRGARSMTVLLPHLVALHLGWRRPADGGMTELGRESVAKAEMRSPGNSTINTEPGFFSTRKNHKAAQTCPERAVVLVPEPGRRAAPSWGGKTCKKLCFPTGFHEAPSLIPHLEARGHIPNSRGRARGESRLPCSATTITPASYFPLSACSYEAPSLARRCPGGSHIICFVPQ